MNSTLRFLVCGDTHCGHIGGLTPPMRWCGHDLDWYRVQEQAYEFWVQKTKGQWDGLFFTGDSIDGKGRLAGGRGLYETSIITQAGLAASMFDGIDINLDQRIAVSGSPYHSGKEEQFERIFAEAIGAQFGNQIDVKVNGITIRTRHFLSTSQTPVGGDIALRKRRINDAVRHVERNTDLADIYLHGHTHVFRVVGGSGWMAYSAPSLQFWSEFGSSKCDGVVHFGILELIVYPDKTHRVIPHTLNIIKDVDKVVDWEEEDNG